MRSRFELSASLVLAGMLLASPAFAAEQLPYNAAQMAHAQAQGKPILVDIAASWCPVCKVQASVVGRELMTKPEFANYVIFDVDFDSQKDVVRKFGATMQSTLIFFKGKKEVARVIGGTDPDMIDAMMHRAVD